MTDLSGPTPALSYTSADLAWTAPGDDGTSGQAAGYELRYATSSITTSTWDTATPVAGLPSPKPAGSKETFKVTGLAAKKTYYFAMKAYDKVLNKSPISNVAKVSTKRKPRSAQNMTATLGSVKLTWDLPSAPHDVPFPVQVTIRKTIGGPAGGPTEGVLVYDGAGGRVTDTSITDGETYYYTAFVYDKDESSNVSDPTSVSISIPPASGPAALTVRALTGTKIYLGGAGARLCVRG